MDALTACSFCHCIQGTHCFMRAIQFTINGIDLRTRHCCHHC